MYFHRKNISQSGRELVITWTLLLADDGPIIWLEGGYKFKTGFNLNARVSMSTMDWNIREGVFKDYKTIQHRQMLDLTFSKPIALKGQPFP